MLEGQVILAWSLESMELGEHGSQIALGRH